MTKFNGKLNRIVFENDQDLFKILDVTIIGKLEDYDREEIKVTGSFGDIQEGGTYTFDGKLVVHNKFGLQFRCDSYKQSVPQEKGSLTRYLSSSKFPGIGKKAADTIISALGTNALTVLKDNPAKVATLPLTKKQKDSLISGVNSMDSYSEIVLKLAQFGLNKKVAARLYQIYHGETLAKLEQDPYAAIAEVTGYAFKSADRMGSKLGIAADDPRRINGAIFQILLDELSKEGNTFVKLALLLTQASKLLQIKQFDPIATCVNNLQHQGKIVVSDEDAALQSIFETENEIALTMKNLIKRKNTTKPYKERAIQTAIKNAEKKLKISYDDTQKLAIKNALTNPISILTGGPGTGKTTIINGILLSLRELAEIPASSLYSSDPPFLLAAPTGRAAKRMEEITGITAKTIHRLLGLGIGENDATDLNELNGEILIIDEMSMVDMFLFKQLISSINDTKHIVFVGDKDQLPSVGAGNVFSDLIKAKAFPTTVLKRIHRQGDDSSIITLAHDINEGEDQQSLFTKTKNYSFISCPPHEVDHVVSQIVERAIAHGFAKDDIQVLGAMYQGPGGVTNLNNVIQEIMNPAKPNSKILEVHDEAFRIGDRVLQLQNNPEKDIYNGQIGKILAIDEKNPQKCMTADFDGREINFSKKDLFDLTRAYAITIHKAQGSEFPLVILSLTMQNYVMLKRNLLYTAVTRAEKNLVLIGDPRAYVMALNTSGNDRQTGLSQKLQEQLGVVSQTTPEKKVETPKIDEQVEEKPKDYLLTSELIYAGKIDPMIGMADIKPGMKH
ncbi:MULTISPECIES: ATP-dependent RecD-like DNA helicase [unclassified Lactobacillus]|uniref:SF1B family DNA helicase RecD2 n=1 Tax=unclassified Lactobacillus TaxID=2620435 RepID=UPI00226A1E76|nr:MULTISPECIES: ATP-dependent RecD-like DNA helicase [unclassified Lactobacillus]MCX8721170.1 ATP-dependent RecD-like DNA helicase [Lactobacillus sp. B4010]MCX8732002.1 ATP-dependent RecD-like DNA helicase [Lactobacillus sp. B4015]MCX8734311.1 ATP-dependent RecD-like DNA helicase [Lactobacillus sp. B4012]